MRRFIPVGLLALVLSGCATYAPGPPIDGPMWPAAGVLYDNPVLLPIGDHVCVWEAVVDVVDDYFKIEREEPVRHVDGILTLGRLETFPEVGSTIFEPWRRDSANSYEKLESTLQTIRRQATVRVTPAEGGYWAEVVVFKELEDVVQPAHATAGAATFRNDSSLTRVVSPIGEQEINEDWIPKGRDMALEQRIIEQLLARVGAARPAPLAGLTAAPPAANFDP